MKSSISSLILMFAIAAQGQETSDPSKKRPMEPARDNKMRLLEFWKQADANNDHKISKQEFLQLPRVSQLPAEKQDKLFAHLDKNQTGTLEAGELAPAAGPHTAGAADPENMLRRPMPRIAEMDRNGDKKITYEEFIQTEMMGKLPDDRRKKMFERMDRNQDGVLSPDDGPPPGQGLRRPDGAPNEHPEGRFPKPQGNPAPHGERGFFGIDANQDKFLDFAELQKSPLAGRMGEDALEDMFESIDANKDLKIDQTEWNQHSAKAMAPSKEPKTRPAPQAPDAKKSDEEMMEEAN